MPDRDGKLGQCGGDAGTADWGSMVVIQGQHGGDAGMAWWCLAMCGLSLSGGWNGWRTVKIPGGLSLPSLPIHADCTQGKQFVGFCTFLFSLNLFIYLCTYLSIYSFIYFSWYLFHLDKRFNC